MGQWFGPELNSFFECQRGAYSHITNDEFNKSQITFTGAEQDLAEDYFGARLDGHHGSIATIRSQGIDPEFEFRIHPSGERKNLTVSYKTGRVNELRFYARSEVFKPKPGEYWCIFQKDSEIWLGSFSEWTLEAIKSGILIPKPRTFILEPEVDDYQDIINNSEPEKLKSFSMKWKRNPLIAMQSLKKRGYKCEIHPDYPGFNFRGTANNFVEAHHLVPMNFQDKFKGENLDQMDNICVLNPLSHRMLHHADFARIESDLIKLIGKRQMLLDRLGLNKYDILEMYVV